LRSTGCIKGSDKTFYYFIISLLIAANSTVLAQNPCPDIGDPCEPDTIWIDCGTKVIPDSGGWVVFPIYLKSDNQGEGNDIVGFNLPLYVSRSNSIDSAWIDTAVSLVFENSAFNDTGNLLSVTADSLQLDGWVGLGAIDFDSLGLLSGTHLVAQMWIHLSDTSSITIDTSSRQSNSLLLVTSLATSYVPIWDKVTCGVQLCAGTAGDVNGTPPISLPDVIHLVNYVFDKDRPGIGCQGSDPGNCWTPEPLCRGEINGVSPIGLPDVIYLVNFVFDKDRPATGCIGSNPGTCWIPVPADNCCF
jgi:hypothetical protein